MMATGLLEKAALLAKDSTCKQAKRGVVIARGDDIAGEGYNGPMPGFGCAEQICASTCNFYSIPAEQRAMIDATRRGKSVREATAYIVQYENGKLVPISPKDYVSIAKYLFEYGIRDLVLPQLNAARRTEYARYEMNDISDVMATAGA